jgi:hypothetical protein
MSVLAEIDAASVDKLTEEDLRAHLLKLSEEREKRRSKQKEYNAKPEQQAKRKAYSERYRTDPEKADKFKASRKAYMQKPEVKARMKAYRTKRNDIFKAITAEAKLRGIDIKALAEQARASLAAKAAAPSDDQPAA